MFYLLKQVMFFPYCNIAAVHSDVLIDKLPEPPGLVPSHRVAGWLLTHIDRMLEYVGLSGNRTAEEWVYIFIIALLALGIGWLIRHLLVWIVDNAFKVRKGRLAHEMVQERTLSKCTHFVTPLFFMALVPFAFNHDSSMLDTILRGAGVYALCTLGMAISAIMTLIYVHYNATSNTRQLPLKGLLNVGKGMTWIIILILSVALLINKSPAGILAGLGAFAAALLLIFKDSILGFTAGIQMAENDMLHVGDWIVVPGTPANGVVLDMSLSTVTVQNFDNTLIYVPPYTLVSGSFQNWRGMSKSGVRRIMQSFTISYDGIVSVTDDLLDKICSKYPLMTPFVDAAHKKTGEGHPEQGTATSVPSSVDTWIVNGGLRQVNGTLETNLGLFRAYLCVYLANNPHISDTNRILVQLLQPTVYGIPLQVWCWANTTDWNAYESIQSAVMEHVKVAAADFGLSVYDAGSEDVTVSGSK